MNAEQLLGGFCHTRGLLTTKNVPNYQSAARIILKDYTSGALLYCCPPPSDNNEKEEKEQENEESEEEFEENNENKEQIEENEDKNVENKEEKEENNENKEEDEESEGENDEDYESFDEEEGENFVKVTKSNKKDEEDEEEEEETEKKRKDPSTKILFDPKSAQKPQDVLKKFDKTEEEKEEDIENMNLDDEIDPTLARDDDLLAELQEKKSKITIGINAEGEKVIFKEKEEEVTNKKGYSVKKDNQIRAAVLRVLEKANDKAETIAKLRQRPDFTKAERQYLKALKRSALALKGKSKFPIGM